MKQRISFGGESLGIILKEMQESKNEKSPEIVKRIKQRMDKWNIKKEKKEGE